MNNITQQEINKIQAEIDEQKRFIEKLPIHIPHYYLTVACHRQDMETLCKMKKEMEAKLIKEYVGVYKPRDDGDYDFVFGYSVELISQIDLTHNPLPDDWIFKNFNEPEFPMIWSQQP